MHIVYAYNIIWEVLPLCWEYNQFKYTDYIPPQRGKTPPPYNIICIYCKKSTYKTEQKINKWSKNKTKQNKIKKCLAYNTKLYLVVRRLLWKVWDTHLLPLLPSPLWPRVVVPVRVTCIDRLGLFKYYSYSKEPCTTPPKQQKTKTKNNNPPKKPNLRNNYTKNTYNKRDSLISRHKITQDGLIYY